MAERVRQVASLKEPKLSDVGTQPPATGRPGRFSDISFRPPEVDIRELFRKVWRRKMALVSIVGLVMLLTFIFVNQAVPLYTGVTKVMIDPREERVVDIQSVVSGLPQDTATIIGEMEILKSRGLAERVITRLKLERDIEFNPPPKEPPFWRKYLSLKFYIPADWYELVVPASKARDIPPREIEDRKKNGLINTFLGNLKLKPVPRSRVIDITYRSKNPRTAALIANTTADLYIVDQLEAKFEATKRATAWLNDRVSTLRKAVGASERAVERFREKAGLIRGQGNTSAASQQISEINTQIILSRTKRAEAVARLRQMERSLKRKNGIDAVAEVLSSPLIQRLREEEARILRLVGELSQDFGEKHPKMINSRSELRDQRAKISIEVKKIVQNLRNEVQVAQARDESLHRSQRQLENRAARSNTNEVQLRALEREANANRTLYETFLSRFKETTNQQNGLQRADARIISRASIPSRSSYPKTKSIYIAAFVSSIFLGFLVVFVIEHMDQGFRSMEQLESITGIHSLGLIPIIGGTINGSSEPYQYVVDRPNSAYGEAVRSLFTSIMLSNIDKPPKTVLITSSFPEEGKTSLSISLARNIAMQAGKKVVLIDADLRRPQVHNELGIGDGPGLVEYLSGEATLEEVMHHDETTGLIVFAAGRSANNPTDILSSEAMKKLILGLGEANDLVIIDSPPVLAVSDPRVLARLADKTLFVVRWAETSREIALTGLKQLHDINADLAGTVLSLVNTKKNSRYGFGDSRYYYGKSKKYYTN